MISNEKPVNMSTHVMYTWKSAHSLGQVDKQNTSGSEHKHECELECKLDE